MNLLMTAAIYCALVGVLFGSFEFSEPALVARSGVRYSTLKALPILALALSVHFTSCGGQGARRLVVIALLAGACGDFLISICPGDIEVELAFFALSSIFFGISHIFYMAGFLRHLKCLCAELALCTLVCAALINYWFLAPGLPHRPFTTLVLMAYSGVLGTALVTSGSLALRGTRWQPPRQKNNILCFVGYCLFLVSDTFILLEHVGLELFPCCTQMLILTTYYSAQYLIMRGAVESHPHSSNNN